VYVFWLLFKFFPTIGKVGLAAARKRGRGETNVPGICTFCELLGPARVMPAHVGGEKLLEGVFEAAHPLQAAREPKRRRPGRDSGPGVDVQGALP
jgi:hypothetical protein